MLARLLAAVAALTLWVAPADAATFKSPWPNVTCGNDHRLLAANKAGVYSPSLRTIVMLPYVCSALGQLQDGLPLTEYRYEALFLLAHELAHASGVADEKAADCHAWRIIGRVAVKIRVPLPARQTLLAFNRGFGWRCG